MHVKSHIVRLLFSGKTGSKLRSLGKSNGSSEAGRWGKGAERKDAETRDDVSWKDKLCPLHNLS